MLEKYNPNSVTAPDAPASWEQVKYWADVAGKFQHASLAAQVMAGFTLSDLKKDFSHGGDRKSGSRPHDAVLISREETCRTEAGISDDTARRWILMAEGVKARWKKLSPQVRLKQLMSTPVSEWTGEDQKLVEEALHKVTDGNTQLEFMRELGLAKKPTGNPNASGKGRRALSLNEQAEVEKVLVTDCMNRLLQDLETLAGRFTVIGKPDLELFDAALMKHHRAIQQWLTSTTAKPADIAKLFAR